MDQPADDFIETMGRHFEEEGVPRIAGRLLGLLMLLEEELSLDDLAERLQVSKGSVSSNARLLEDWGVAERITHSGDRRDFYRVSRGIPQRLVRRQISRLELLNERLAHARVELAALPPAVAERFTVSAQFNEMVIRSLRGLQNELDGGGGRTA